MTNLSFIINLVIFSNDIRTLGPILMVANYVLAEYSSISHNSEIEFQAVLKLLQTPTKAYKVLQRPLVKYHLEMFISLY